jgi:hypothetical protein
MRKQPKARTTKSKSRQDNFYTVEKQKPNNASKITGRIADENEPPRRKNSRAEESV